VAFPTTGILDNFNRGNEGPPPSANWFTPTGPVGMGGLKVAGNQCIISDLNDIGYGSAFWTGSTFGPDCEAYITGVTVPDEDVRFIRLYLRMTTTDYATMDGYIVSFVYDTSQCICQISRIDNGANTQLGADINITLSDGDKLGADISGVNPSTITAYQDTGGGWASIGSREDSDHDGAGYIALAANDLITTVMDDFGGGDFTSSSSDSSSSSSESSSSSSSSESSSSSSESSSSSSESSSSSSSSESSSSSSESSSSSSESSSSSSSPDLGWSAGKVSGIEDIAKIMDVDISNINKVMGI